MSDNTDFEERITTKTEIYLIRHGETDWNRRRALQGRLNTPLNDTGIAQAREAAAKLAAAGVQFDLVFSSPLQRALTTASIVSGIPISDIIQDDRILEIAFGSWEGREMSSIGAALTPFFEAPQNYVPPEGGESYDALLRRTREFLQMLQTQHVGKRILVASHGAATAAMLVYARKLSVEDLWSRPVKNCAVFKLEVKNGMLVEAIAPF